MERVPEAERRAEPRHHYGEATTAASAGFLAAGVLLPPLHAPGGENDQSRTRGLALEPPPSLPRQRLRLAPAVPRGAGTAPEAVNRTRPPRESDGTADEIDHAGRQRPNGSPARGTSSQSKTGIQRSMPPARLVERWRHRHAVCASRPRARRASSRAPPGAPRRALERSSPKVTRCMSYTRPPCRAPRGKAEKIRPSVERRISGAACRRASRRTRPRGECGQLGRSCRCRRRARARRGGAPLSTAHVAQAVPRRTRCPARLVCEAPG